MNELTEKNNKLQQEELQKKNTEQTVGQLKVTSVFYLCNFAVSLKELKILLSGEICLLMLCLGYMRNLRRNLAKIPKIYSL